MGGDHREAAETGAQRRGGPQKVESHWEKEPWHRDSPEMPRTQAVAPSSVGGARASDLTLRTHLLSPWEVWVV